MVELGTHQTLTEPQTGASVERLADLEAKITRAYRQSRAPATLAAYRSDWDDFTTWCDTVGLNPLPADPTTVAAYLAELADPPDDRSPLAASTIQRRVVSIGEAHKAATQPNPCQDPLVKQVTKGIRRQIGIAPKHRKTGLSTADIKAMVATLDPTKTIDIRDKAILLLGFATALRRSELVALNIEDIENHTEGLIVWKRRSKTDQEAAGQHIEVAYGTNAVTCPVRAYRTWTTHAHITTGPIFRPVNRHNAISETRLSDKAIANTIKKHATRLGLNPHNFAGHSLRRGFTTEAARNGAPERTIAATTHHTTTKGLQPYIADAETFTDPPSRYLDL